MWRAKLVFPGNHCAEIGGGRIVVRNSTPFLCPGIRCEVANAYTVPPTNLLDSMARWLCIATHTEMRQCNLLCNIELCFDVIAQINRTNSPRQAAIADTSVEKQCCGTFPTSRTVLLYLSKVAADNHAMVPWQSLRWSNSSVESVMVSTHMAPDCDDFWKAHRQGRNSGRSNGREMVQRSSAIQSTSARRPAHYHIVPWALAGTVTTSVILSRNSRECPSALASGLAMAPRMLCSI